MPESADKMYKNVKILFSLLSHYLRLFFTLLFLHMLEMSVAQSQRVLPYFSTISEIPLYRGNQNLLVGDFNGDGYNDICAYGSGIISIAYREQDSLLWKVKYFEIGSKNFKAKVDDINLDNVSDIVYLDSEKKYIGVYLGTEEDTISIKWKFKLEDSFSNFIVADVNNDNKKDILLFGKKNIGITIFLGKGDGAFRYPQVILQDYFFSDITICNCSEDDIPDIFAINWIENKILYFTSYAPMKFLSPAVISLNSEPISIITSYINDDDLLDLLVLMEDRQTILTFFGDNLGNYVPNEKLYLPYKIEKQFLADINQNSVENLVTISPSEKLIGILEKNVYFQFKENIVYSLGIEASDYELYNLKNSDFYDLILSSEKNKKLYLILNHQNNINPESQIRYVTNPFPDKIFTFDSNILISSYKDYNCAYYSYLENRQFDGPIYLKGFPKNVETFNVISNNDSIMTILTTHNNIPTVNLVSINKYNYESFYYPVSGLPQPRILYFKKLNNDKIEFFISSQENNSKYSFLYHYEQIGKYKFSEKLINSFGNKILGITVNDVINDGNPGYLYLKELYGNKIALMSSLPDTAYSTLKNVKHFEFQDTISSNYVLITKDLNKDGYLDLILYAPEKRELSISIYNTVNGRFAKPHHYINNIKLNSLNNLQILDFDADTNYDLVIGNLYTQTLQIYFGKGDAVFTPPQTLMGIYEINSFLVKDFNGDSLTDIALVYKDGYLKMIYGQK